VRAGFHTGRASGCQPAGPEPISDRLLGKSRLAEVTGDPLRLRLEHLGKARLDDARYAGVQCLPALSEQAFISGVSHKCVLEYVGGCRGDDVAEEKLLSDEVNE